MSASLASAMMKSLQDGSAKILAIFWSSDFCIVRLTVVAYSGHWAPMGRLVGTIALAGRTGDLGGDLLIRLCVTEACILSISSGFFHPRDVFRPGHAEV